MQVIYDKTCSINKQGQQLHALTNVHDNDPILKPGIGFPEFLSECDRLSYRLYYCRHSR